MCRSNNPEFTLPTVKDILSMAMCFSVIFSHHINAKRHFIPVLVFDEKSVQDMSRQYMATNFIPNFNERSIFTKSPTTGHQDWFFQVFVNYVKLNYV